MYYLGSFEFKVLEMTSSIGFDKDRYFIWMMQNIPWFGKPKGLLRFKAAPIFSQVLNTSTDALILVDFQNSADLGLLLMSSSL